MAVGFSQKNTNFNDSKDNAVENAISEMRSLQTTLCQEFHIQLSGEHVFHAIFQVWSASCATRPCVYKQNCKQSQGNH